jgi:hypothetical protein
MSQICPCYPRSRIHLTCVSPPDGDSPPHDCPSTTTSTPLRQPTLLFPHHPVCVSLSVSLSDRHLTTTSKDTTSSQGQGRYGPGSGGGGRGEEPGGCGGRAEGGSVGAKGGGGWVMGRRAARDVRDPVVSSREGGGHHRRGARRHHGLHNHPALCECTPRQAL